MPTIEGHFPMVPDPERMRPCVLCLEPTDVLAVAPGLDPPTELPLHVFCAAWLVRMYGRRNAGRLSDSDRELLEAYAGRVLRLISGGA